MSRYKIVHRCYECGTTEQIQQHHIIPVSRGGTATVPLCCSCHDLAHGVDRKSDLNKLIKEGLERARKAGKVLGRPRVVDDSKVLKLREKGYTYSKIAKELNISKASVWKSLNQ